MSSSNLRVWRRSPANLSALRGNLFDGAHAAIGDWHTLPWHRDKPSHQVKTNAP